MRCHEARARRGLGCVLATLVVAVAAGSDSTFEPIESLRASELLSPALRSGPHHQVDEAVSTDGLLYMYRVSSEFGEFDARGEDRLRVRIHEIEVLAHLRDERRTPDFEAAAQKAGPNPFISIQALADGPIGQLDPSMGGALLLPGLPGSAGETGDFLGQLFEFHTTKRILADAVEVDTYSRNAPLQRALDEHAWVIFAGGAALPSAVPARPGAESSSSRSERLEDMLRDYSEEDLERLNRIELAVMGVPEALREEFIAHPSYSTTHETALVEALAALEGTDDRVAFIEAAVDAGSEDDAHSYQRMAEMMRSYASSGGTLERIVRVDGAVAGQTPDGTRLVPVHADHALWTQDVAAFAESLAIESGDETESTKTHILFSGSVSPIARERLEGLGLAVDEGAFETSLRESETTENGERP
jgi:hypothetical protein